MKMKYTIAEMAEKEIRLNTTGRLTPDNRVIKCTSETKEEYHNALHDVFDNPPEFDNHEAIDAQDQQFNENRAQEVLYYQKAIVEARKLERLKEIKKLIKNRTAYLGNRSFDDEPELQRTIKEYDSLLAYVEAKLKSVEDTKEGDRDSVEEILKSMFKNISATELDTLKSNLVGADRYLALTFIGLKGDLNEKLKKLKHAGVDRNEILRVFPKYVRWKQNNTKTSSELTKKGLYRKI